MHHAGVPLPLQKKRSALELYPVLLRDAGRASRSPADQEACVEALFRHYGLDPHSPDLNTAGRLARLMCEDFVPAFGRGRGRPKKASVPTGEEFSDWECAGGGFLDCPSDLTAFYQAQLVQLVAAKQRGGASRSAVMSRLVKTAEARATLPRRYRGIAKASSLGQVYKLIPSDVRSAPSLFLPLRPR